MHCFTAFKGFLEDPNLPAWIQAITAVVVAAFAVIAAVISWKALATSESAVAEAVKATKAAQDSVAAARESAGVAREALEKEWQPDLRIADIARSQRREMDISVVNLARPGVLIERVFVMERHGATKAWHFRTSVMVAGGARQTVEIGQALSGFYLQCYPQQQNQFERDLKVWLEYFTVDGERRKTPPLFLRAAF